MGKYHDLLDKFKKRYPSNQKNLKNPDPENDGGSAGSRHEIQKHYPDHQKNLKNPEEVGCFGFLGDSDSAFEKLQPADGDTGGDLATAPEAQTQNRQAVGFAADPVVVPDPAGALPETQNRQSAGFEQVVVADVAGALNRPLAYLLEADDRLEGLALMIEADIADIRSGRLPLASARLYLEREEAAHPHLARRLKSARMAITRADDKPDTRHPLELAIERLRLDGLDLRYEDGKFIRERIGTRANWKALLQEYSDRWLLAAATEAAPHRRQNVGRRAANSWLLEVTR